MQNDYSNKSGQAQSATDKATEFARSAGQQPEQKGQEIGRDAQQLLKHGQEQAGKFIDGLDKQVRQNPWLIVAGVAVGAFVLGSLLNKSNKS